MVKDYWHFFRHHGEFALLCANENKRVIDRKWTLDHIICRMEGIKLSDLHILIRDPDSTRGEGNKAQLVKKILVQEKEFKKLEQEKCLIRFRENQAKLKADREKLIAKKNAYDLLGFSAEYKIDLQRYNNQII